MSILQYSRRVAEVLFRLGNVIRVARTILDATKNGLEDDKQIEAVNNRDPEGQKVFYIKLDGEEALFCNIFQVPKHFLISKILDQKVPEEQVLQRLV